MVPEECALDNWLLWIFLSNFDGLKVEFDKDLSDVIIQMLFFLVLKITYMIFNSSRTGLINWYCTIHSFLHTKKSITYYYYVKTLKFIEIQNAAHDLQLFMTLLLFYVTCMLALNISFFSSLLIFIIIFSTSLPAHDLQ